MGFYLRRSKKVGPFRLNLSKSGIGISAGVRGARLGVGPRGAYVHAGRNGIYYRKSLTSSSGQNTPTSSNLPFQDAGAPGARSTWPLLATFVVLAILMAVLLNNNVESDVKVVAAPAPHSIFPDVATQRKDVIRRLTVADADRKAFKKAQSACLKAVEKDSHVKRNRSWIISDELLQMSYYFTHDDSRDPRLFTAYNYDCDATTGKAILSNVRQRVDSKSSPVLRRR